MEWQVRASERQERESLVRRVFRVAEYLDEVGGWHCCVGDHGSDGRILAPRQRCCKAVCCWCRRVPAADCQQEQVVDLVALRLQQAMAQCVDTSSLPMLESTE